MVQNVNYYWIQVLASLSCQNCSICTVSLCTLYQSLQQLCRKLQVGNGQCISVLFVIPIIIEVHNHRFEIYTLVSEIHGNIDLVLGIKNIFELEGVINSRDCRFEFLNRSVPIYPEKEIVLKPDKQN